MAEQGPRFYAMLEHVKIQINALIKA